MPLLDLEQPTETTPLIQTSSTTTNRDIARTALPAITQVVELLATHPPTAASLAQDVFPDWCPDTLSSVSQKAAFALVVLLKLLDAHRSRALEPSLNTWAQWSTEEERIRTISTVETEALVVWNYFVDEFRTSEDIEELLWFMFPLSHEGTECIRVVDLLVEDNMLEEILTHPVVYHGLLRRWKSGPINLQRKETLYERILQRIGGACTPRVMHLYDLILHSAYLVGLMHYAVLPPVPSTDMQPSLVPQFREFSIMVYASSQLLRTWRPFHVPYVLVVLAFLSCLPSVPLSQDLAYGILLTALCLNVLQLHLPIAPSPIYLLPPERVLPLSVLIFHGTLKIFLPVLLFFLPAVLLTLFLLSISLSDILLQISYMTTLDPSPLEARTAFLLLLTILSILLLSSLIMLILVYPTLSSSPPRNPWDRYSRTIGLDARKCFARVVVVYSELHFFPAPFVVLRLFALVPSLLLSRFSVWEVWRHWLVGLETLLWRMFIVPGALVVAGAWCWGLF